MTPTRQNINIEEVLEDIKYLLAANQNDFLLNILIDLHPADISDLIEHLVPEDRDKVFALLPSELASDVLAELESAPKEEILEELDSAQIAELVNEMDSDDATDVLAELSEAKASEVLARVEDEYSEDIKELMHYPEDSAGGIMAKEYVAVNINSTVAQAIEELRNMREEVEEIYHCYAIDDQGCFVGNITLKELILAYPEQLLIDIVDQDVFTIVSHLDQEEVAHIFQKYDLVAAPVVDKTQTLIGRITIDDIIDVINEETDEDMARIAGVGEEEILEESTLRIVQSRLPWLIIAFGGQLVSAFIMEFYEATITQIVASAFFIPLVMAMGGSIGQQTSIIVVRGLATGEINPHDIKRRLLREARAALINGTVIAVLIFWIVVLWQDNLKFALVLSCTLIAVILTAALFGAMIPFGFRKFKVDPAIASGPFVTTFNDVVGLIIYFSLLAMALKYALI